MAQRVLRVTFEDAEAFQREYQQNLVNGGVFVATDDTAELRERVTVEVALPFCKQQLALQGEIVHQVTPEMAQMGAPVGVAVQFEGPAHRVRAQLDPLRTACGVEAHEPKDPGRRRSPRTRARVPAQIDGGDGPVAGHTRDLSQTGVLVSVPGRGATVGQKVRIALTDPSKGESLSVDGIVVRQVETEGGVSAVALEFAPGEDEREVVERFVEGVQTTEHTRRLGGITGDVAELGVDGLLQMFANTAPAGTLTLRRGEQEGLVGFEAGLLRFVRLGPASGMKALVRLLGWKEGSFEFHARLDAVEQMDAPLPFEAALLDAARMFDESKRIDPSRFPADATPRVVDGDPDDEDLTKVEAAVLDLARAGFSVKRMVEVIPEPDPEIYRALDVLTDQGVLCF